MSVLLAVSECITDYRYIKVGNRGAYHATDSLHHILRCTRGVSISYADATFQELQRSASTLISPYNGNHNHPGVYLGHRSFMSDRLTDFVSDTLRVPHYLDNARSGQCA
jgi:hypothetical protein